MKFSVLHQMRICTVESKMELAVSNLHKDGFLKLPWILILENWMPSILNFTTLC